MGTFLKTSLIFLLFLLINAAPALAARTVSITADKSALFGDEQMSVTASASGFTNGETIYLKGAFYQDGATNYFGYTQNGDNWIKNGDSTLNQRQVAIGNWDGNIAVKTDFSDSGYIGEGGYKFKLGFYYLTSGGNLSAVNWSTNNLDVNISEPDPTSTPTPLPPIPTKAATPTPTKSPTAYPTQSITKFPTTALIKSASLSAGPISILGIASKSADKKATPSATPKKKILVENDAQNNLYLITIIFGALLLLSCAIIAYFKMTKNQE